MYVGKRPDPGQPPLFPVGHGVYLIIFKFVFSSFKYLL